MMFLRKRDRIVSKSKYVGVGGDRPSSGFGYIIIPNGVDRSDYIYHVNRSGSCFIVTARELSVIKDVKVPKHILRDLEFPEKSGEYGSPVSWQNTPGINQVVLTGVLVSPLEVGAYNKDTKAREYSSKQCSFGESITLSDENGANYSMSLIDNSKDTGSISLSASGSDGNTAKVKVGLNGQSEMYGDTLSKVKSYEQVDIEVGSSDDNNLCNLKILNTGIFEYTDYNGNFVKIEKGKVTVESKDGEIILGSGATEKAILGNKAQTELNKSKARISGIIQAIQSAPVVAQDGGAAFKSSLVASLSALVAEDYSNILSNTNKLK